MTTAYQKDSSSDKKLTLVFENRLYDVSKFAKVHPGGSLIIEDFSDCDVTDYFIALHSEKALKMLRNMPSTEIPKADQVPRSDYLKLNDQLEKQGLFKADYFTEFVQIFHTIGFFALATYLGSTYPLIAVICMGFGTLISGWIGHQCDHQRNNIMRDVNLWYATIGAGLSPNWWSFKHNRHHLSTNEIDHDGDIQLLPWIFLWKPRKDQDTWNRAFQHIYFSALYSILHLKWQIDSVIWAITYKNYREVIGLAIHWTWYLTCLPWTVWFLGVLVSGTISAWVVTASHQAELKLEGKKYFDYGEKPTSKYQIHDYVAHQLITTRNIDIGSWFINYICGGMQYQIEHHVFPRMPLYKLPLVKPAVEKFAAEHGLAYEQESFWDITKRNYRHIETCAKEKL